MPEISHFAPLGHGLLPEEIILTLDEFEAIRLKDLLAMEQEKAAEQMGISQPTFHRLILGARKKVADALVNNKIIKIQGGDYEMIAPIKGRGFGGLGRGMGRGRGLGAGPVGFCICPKCGNKQPKVPSLPCTQIKCKKCGALMTRS